ncbi:MULTISPECIES: DUF1643 domain-containing protein [unclassified Solibacillus]|uniref:DUF1643 domain-containing protein n=1 Tax=unclassified Solibacillus TaxID=2637870 RepID=UPI0030F69EF1
MIEKEILNEDLFIDKGTGYAVFNSKVNPTKRYFLEKRWKNEGEVLAIIMTNPSNANALGSDKTVEFLMEYASFNDFAALHVINIIPIINGYSAKVSKIEKEVLEKNVVEKKSIHYIKTTIENADKIILGWGDLGHKYFKYLIKEEEELIATFRNKMDVTFAFGFGAKDNFPKHPRPNNAEKYVFQKDSKVYNVKGKMEKWLGIKKK